ncbi:heparan-alpha-glucosaminide N-acetyltransferase domain-containing protein [Nocardioides lentus]|uniref:Heparan-alpha-glucosaminide N-acetyltransferase domain-containing protein n=1 Tax=Nocardioides lentus TaxID=338077 RepID=A0ABN2PM83_9ACTN
MALLGMVATHVVAERDLDGSLTAAHWVAGGRASALFAVLAGVTLALGTGGTAPVRGRERVARSYGFVVRAVVLAGLGLLLGAAGSGLAVILTYYGVLFVLGLPFVGLRARWLWLAAAVWCVAAPVVSQVVRPALPERGFTSPEPTSLAEPARLVSELLLTGYYPAVPWLTYLLVGLAIGRCDLRRLDVAASLAVAGGVLAVAATAVSRLLTERADVVSRLLVDVPAPDGEALLDRLAGGTGGTTPTGGSWAWLLTVAPHSATPFDLAQTAGSAMLVVGACLLVTLRLPAATSRAVEVGFGAGRMSLSLYTLHVVLRTPDVWPPDDHLAPHVLVLLLIGAGFAAAGRRGPLEAAVTAVSRAAERSVRGPAPGPGPGPDQSPR